MTRVAVTCGMAVAMLGLLPTPLGAQTKKEPKFRGKTAAQWLERLTSGKEDERQEALGAIGQLGQPAKQAAAPVLIEMLEDRDPAFRGFAAYGLGRLGPDARDAVPALIEALKDEERVDWGQIDGHLKVRDRAIEALAAIGPAVAPAIPALKNLYDKAPPKDGKEAYRLTRSLIDTFGCLGPKAAPILMDIFAKSDQAWVCENVCLALANLGPQAKAIVPQLAKALPGKGLWCRAEGARALWQIDKHPPAIAMLAAVVEEYATASPEPDWYRAHQGQFDLPAGLRNLSSLCNYLADIGPDAKQSVPSLTKLLANEQREIRLQAAWALWKIARHKDSLAELEKCLIYTLNANDPLYKSSMHIDTRIVWWLGEIGPEAKAAIPTLLKARELATSDEPRAPFSASETRPTLRDQINETIRKIDPEKAGKTP
jgi:HEAT repeat protein